MGPTVREPPQRYTLLLVEDNTADAELVRILLRQIPPAVDLILARDGAEAWNILQDPSHFDKLRGIPDLILLDLNLPRKDGRSLLKDLKADAQLCRIPVVILSTSNSPTEVNEVYRLGAAAFLTKPVDIAHFQTALDVLSRFYFSIAQLPTRGE